MPFLNKENALDSYTSQLDNYLSQGDIYVSDIQSVIQEQSVDIYSPPLFSLVYQQNYCICLYDEPSLVLVVPEETYFSARRAVFVGQH